MTVSQCAAEAGVTGQPRVGDRQIQSQPWQFKALLMLAADLQLFPSGSSCRATYKMQIGTERSWQLLLSLFKHPRQRNHPYAKFTFRAIIPSL